MAEDLHALDMCPDCNGLRVVKAARFEATDVRMNGSDGRIIGVGPATITLTQLPGPCPNPRREETDSG